MSMVLKSWVPEAAAKSTHVAEPAFTWVKVLRVYCMLDDPPVGVNVKPTRLEGVNTALLVPAPPEMAMMADFPPLG